MFIVKANNILNDRNYSAKFETESKANEWLQEHISKQTFGKNARQAIKDQDQYDPSLVISEFEDTQELPNGETEIRTIVSLKAEYTFEGPTLIDGSGATPEDKQFRMDEARNKASQFKVFKEFGETVELYFTALINERNYTQAQKDSLQVNAEVGAVLTEFKFGRIAKAKGLVDAMVADQDLFFESDLNEISRLMADFLEDYPL